MTTTETAPNTTLRAVRLSLRLSQDEFAAAIRRAGAELGEPNEAGKRTVQRLEAGAVRYPRAAYVRALERATGVPIEQLGFVVPLIGARGDAPDGEPADTAGSPGASPHDNGVTYPLLDTRAAYGSLSGIWLSRYVYHSSGRGGDYEGAHYVVLQHRGAKLTGRSIPEGTSAPGSALTLEFDVQKHIVTGRWREQTQRTGYYRGAGYWGALQLVVSPTGRRMAGQWVGFGSEGEVNNGPWSLRFQTSDTGPASVAEHARPPR